MNVSEYRLNKFYVDNRPGLEQRWVLTLESREPRGYSQVVRWWRGKTEFMVYVWGNPLEITEAQRGVLSYWAVCFNANPFTD